MKWFLHIAILISVLHINGYSDSRCMEAGITQMYPNDCKDFYQCLHSTGYMHLNALWVGGSYGFPNGAAVLEWPVAYVESGSGEIIPDVNTDAYSANYIYLPLEDPWTDAAYMTALNALRDNLKVIVFFCFDPSQPSKRVMDRIVILN